MVCLLFQVMMILVVYHLKSSGLVKEKEGCTTYIGHLPVEAPSVDAVCCDVPLYEVRVEKPSTVEDLVDTMGLGTQVHDLHKVHAEQVEQGCYYVICLEMF